MEAHEHIPNHQCNARDVSADTILAVEFVGGFLAGRPRRRHKDRDVTTDTLFIINYYYYSCAAKSTADGKGSDYWGKHGVYMAYNYLGTLYGSRISFWCTQPVFAPSSFGSSLGLLVMYGE